MRKALEYVLQYMVDPFRTKEINKIHVNTMSNLDEFKRRKPQEEIRNKCAPLSALVGNDRYRSADRRG